MEFEDKVLRKRIKFGLSREVLVEKLVLGGIATMGRKSNKFNQHKGYAYNQFWKNSIKN